MTTTKEFEFSLFGNRVEPNPFEVKRRLPDSFATAAQYLASITPSGPYRNTKVRKAGGGGVAQAHRIPDRAIMESMATVYLTEAELAKDLHAALEKVQHGVEIVIAQNERPVAVLKASRPEGRMISEVVADLKARGCDVVLGDDFATDIEEGVRANRHPWNPPSWD